MKHYTNKITNEVFGYESIEVAKEYNDDFENLVEMTDEQFIQFRDNRPMGGKWTYKGWVIDEKPLKEEREAEKQSQIQQLQSDLDDIEKRITRLERIKDRTEEEEQELERLIDESTKLFRKIEANT